MEESDLLKILENYVRTRRRTFESCFIEINAEIKTC